MGKNQHVVKRDNVWAVLGENNSRDTKVHKNQSDAITHAREISQNQKSELLIYGQNGKIRERNSYGNDSYPSRG